MSYKRNTLHLYDSADPTLDFSISNSGGVVTMVVDPAETLTVSGKAVFSGVDTYVNREDGGVVSEHSFESLFDNLDTGVATNVAAIAAEVARANAAETALNTLINNESTALQSTEAVNHAAAMSAIATEEIRATDTESVLASNLAAETARATAAESAINNAIGALTAQETADYLAASDALTAEIARAIAAETVIQNDVDANEAAAAAALAAAAAALQSDIDTNAADIVAEVNRATNAEIALQESIDGILSNVAPEALDSLTEIVSHFSAADNTATQLVGLLISRVSAIQSVIDTLLDPDLPALDSLLTAAAL